MARPAADFPTSISLTITNHCNLRCKMCGQWSEDGYVRGDTGRLRREMTLDDWKRIVDELAAHGTPHLLLRGGEPFMFPGIVELLEYIHHRGIFISVDTNGTLLDRYAEDLVRLGRMHLTISVDGPEEVHDAVRGVPGTFQRLKAGISRLTELEAAGGETISRSICFTISPFSYGGLGDMPDVARSLGIASIAIVPYYYFPEEVGRDYERELRALDCQAYSWVGFHHEGSGVDPEEFTRQYRRYLAGLGEVYDYPYLKLSEAEYRAWFSDSRTPVGPHQGCTNVEKLIDIQPDGTANFCVDFVDYAIGSVRDSSIESLWNGERAERFRRLRRERPLAVCYRCGAKYMSEIVS